MRVCDGTGDYFRTAGLFLYPQPMTRDEATAEAERRQHLHPDAKWVATQRGNQWTIARIGLTPTTIKQTGTATKAPPVAPRDDPYSQLEIVTRKFGTTG